MGKQKNKHLPAVLGAIFGAVSAAGVVAMSVENGRNTSEAFLRRSGLSDIRTQYSLGAAMMESRQDEIYNCYDFTAKNQDRQDMAGYVCTNVFTYPTYNVFGMWFRK